MEENDYLYPLSGKILFQNGDLLKTFTLKILDNTYLNGKMVTYYKIHKINLE